MITTWSATRLGLVEVVGGEQHAHAVVAQLGDDLRG